MSGLSRLSIKRWVGLVLLGLLLVLAVGEPLLLNGDPNKQNLSAGLISPNVQYWLGTDQYGRNMLARIAGGLRISFLLALFCVGTAAVSGVLAGVLAAWQRGWIDITLNFIANTILALPGLVLILIFAALIPGSFAMLYLAISLVLWVEFFRVVRALTLPVISGPQLQSSQILGFGPVYLFRRHIWPAIRHDVFSLAAFGAATSIIAMSSVGFVYVGLKPPTPELGLMIVELFPYYHEAPWLLAEPITVLFMLVLGFHLLADKPQ
ncbi:MAG: ABC transporter permease [Alteromonadaceae bacterium]|nr:ABC transporter permease [Alteromonadaceae bacterium]